MKVICILMISQDGFDSEASWIVPSNKVTREFTDLLEFGHKFLNITLIISEKPFPVFTSKLYNS